MKYMRLPPFRFDVCIYGRASARMSGTLVCPDAGALGSPTRLNRKRRKDMSALLIPHGKFEPTQSPLAPHGRRKPSFEHVLPHSPHTRGESTSFEPALPPARGLEVSLDPPRSPAHTDSARLQPCWPPSTSTYCQVATTAPLPPPPPARYNIKMKTLKHHKCDIAISPTNYCKNKL